MRKTIQFSQPAIFNTEFIIPAISALEITELNTSSEEDYIKIINTQHKKICRISHPDLNREAYAGGYSSFINESKTILLENYEHIRLNYNEIKQLM